MICIECGMSIDEGNHGPCVRALIAKLRAALADRDRVLEQLHDAGILSRRR